MKLKLLQKKGSSLAAMFTAAVIASLGLVQQSEAAGFDTPGWSITPGATTLPLITNTWDNEIRTTGIIGEGGKIIAQVSYRTGTRGSISIFPQDYNFVFRYIINDTVNGVRKRLSFVFRGKVFSIGDYILGSYEKTIGDLVDSLNSSADAVDFPGVWSYGPLSAEGFPASLVYTVGGADADGDGVPDAEDPYPDSLSVEDVPVIVVGNLLVENVIVDGGTTLADLINDVLSRDLGAEGMVVYLQAWRDAGYITGREMGQIIEENNTN